MKRICCLLLAMLFILLSCAGLAERAQVKTPGGWLNMRKAPDTRSPLLKKVPNYTHVTYLGQENDEWSKISYQGVTGYVQSKFLSLTQTAEGKTLYPDAKGEVHVRKTASDTGKILATIPYTQGVTVLEVYDTWSKITFTDEKGNTIEGYILTDRIADQYTEPQSENSLVHYNETGILRSKQKVYALPDKESDVTVTVNKGDQVTVLYTEGSWCRIRLDRHYTGFVPKNTVQLTGKEPAAAQDPLASYTATYYLCTVPSGKLPVYVEPTGDLKGDLRDTLAIGSKEKLAVVKHTHSSHGTTWAQVIHNGNLYWTPAKSIKVSKETDTMYYETPVRVNTETAVYAKKGAKLYESGSRYSKVLATIPEGTELIGSLGNDGVYVTYRGKNGYVLYGDIVCGLAQHIDSYNNWYYYQHLGDPAPVPTATPNPKLDDSRHMAKGEARSLADDALRTAYQAKNLSKMQVNGEKHFSKRGSENPAYEFAYFQNGKYMYNAVVDAITGKIVFTADYTDFGQTVSHATATPRPYVPNEGEISASKARSIADNKLRSSYGGFDNHSYKVEQDRYEKTDTYNEPVFRLNYYAGDQFAYTCIVSARKGTVLYHTDVWDSRNTEITFDTPTPAPVYESTVDIGKAKARSISDSYLTGKYPDFSGAKFISVTIELVTEGGSWEKPYYNIVYYMENNEFYQTAVHAYTGKILYSFGQLPGEGNG